MPVRSLLTLYYLIANIDMQDKHLSNDNINPIINFLCLCGFFFPLEIPTSGKIPNSSLVKPASIHSL